MMPVAMWIINHCVGNLGSEETCSFHNLPIKAILKVLWIQDWLHSTIIALFSGKIVWCKFWICTCNDRLVFSLNISNKQSAFHHLLVIEIAEPQIERFTLPVEGNYFCVPPKCFAWKSKLGFAISISISFNWTIAMLTARKKYVVQLYVCPQEPESQR